MCVLFFLTNPYEGKLDIWVKTVRGYIFAKTKENSLKFNAVPVQTLTQPVFASFISLSFSGMSFLFRLNFVKARLP